MKPTLRMRLEGVELIRRPVIQDGSTVFSMVATEVLRAAAASLEDQLYDAIVAVCRQRFDAVPEETVLESVLSTVRERRGRLVWSLVFSERYTTLAELNVGQPYTLDVECRGVWVSSLTDIRLDLKLLQVAMDEKAVASAEEAAAAAAQAQAQALEAERATLLEAVCTRHDALRAQREQIEAVMRELEGVKEAVAAATNTSELEACRERFALVPLV